MASKAAEDPSDNAGGSENSLKIEEPVAKDPPKSAPGFGNGAKTEGGAAHAATSESVGGSEEARSKGGARSKRSSCLDRIVVVHRPPCSGGFMASFPIIALALTWGCGSWIGWSGAAKGRLVRRRLKCWMIN
ncbi:hypothetical protein RHGRI_030400 [Rhododendron griersonianum]|uniref:Uncharacterized protein n=1 Tax=Rhododendron griersonianum TaxID=479676 RepID=A0AAV6IPZ4_9ERIC|nr:hypothetical protein RHGRI_030400 [Rhododendron griersonianum]